MTDKNSLVTKRGSVKGQLTRFSTYLSNLSDPLSVTIVDELKLRLSRAKELLTEFNDIQQVIETLDNDVASHEQVKVEFEDTYFSLISKAMALLEKHAECKTSLNIQRANQTTVSVKLPQIDLPSFTGQFNKWREFYDTFTSIIHENNSLSDIQKFHYLRCSLKNEAATVIQSLEASEANYAIAWKMICERFDNKRLIIYNHVKALVNLKHVTRDSNFTLRNLLDEALTHIRALSALGQPTEHWDTFLIYIIGSKLDPSSRREWEFYKILGELPTVSEFQTFLQKRCEILESINTDIKGNRFKNQTYSKGQNNQSKSDQCFFSNTPTCFMCKGQHLIYNCTNFLKLSTEERMKQVKTKQLCINCLRKGHNQTNCKSSACKKCNQKHNTLLHTDNTVNKDDDQVNDPPSTTLVTNTLLKQAHQILLATACVNVFNNNRKQFTCRVLLDSGSQSNFVTERLCNLLNLRKSPINSSVTGINQSLLSINAKTQLTISSVHNNFQVEIPCLVLNNITDHLPNTTFDPSILNIPNNIHLADPDFHKSRPIDMLIGSQLFWQLLSVGQINLGNHYPILQKTQLGWIVTGPIPLASQLVNHNKSFCSLTNIEQQLHKFWELESVNPPQLSSTEKYCEDLFNNTTERKTEGRFVVDIPFTQSLSDLGQSKQAAVERQHSLERKFAKNPQFATEYKTFMAEYESLGHMSLVTKESDLNQPHFYLPHHAVIKRDSVTTKLRVVFDGSAKTSSGLSLNDIQAVGPSLQQDLCSILLRFRTHTFVVTSDIAKMYRQILIHPKQRDMQRIVWRETTEEPLRSYTLNTVTYGTTSAPYLALRCLKQLGIENQSCYPRASNIILNDFYVDDLLSGASSTEELVNVCTDVDNILKQAGFELRKWNSNSLDVLNSIPSVSKDDVNTHIRLGEDSKVLGIYWVPSRDTLQYNIKLHNTKVTKRMILSTVAQIYDPLGLLSPVIISTKILIQMLWQANLHWDESLPIHLYSKWKILAQTLPTLNELHIPRCVIPGDACRIELHGFCDASTAAYGACIYIRSVENDKISTHLICAKSKVAPLKQVTLPRLELSGALLLSELTEKVRTALQHINFHACYYWCDSTIVLAWIRSSPQRWQTFVSNRVTAIQNVTSSNDWHHVRSQENPADLVSRGITAKQLIHNDLWWSGPSWLNQSSDLWPLQDNEPTDSITLEAKRVLVLRNSTTTFDIFNKYSSFMKLKRVMAYVLPFLSNCRIHKIKRNSGMLLIDELNTAETVILKSIQRQSFAKEYHELQDSKSINHQSKLVSLHPFLDEHGLIRVGGRLSNSNFEFSKKHPIILPSGHHITEIVTRDEHIRLLHCGPQALLASLRDRYWPITGRNLARKVCRSCVICFRIQPTPSYELMGNLPATRLKPARPFSTSGVDYAGPFLIKDRKTRGAKLVKSYVCLFVCFVTKAIHLELVCDLTTQSFLSALKRFMSRRGQCSDIYSDNATNFVGANNSLSDIYNFLRNENDNIRNVLSNENIAWHFIPPKSPHFGGLWEAGVRRTKYHLKRVLGNTKLTYEEFNTILVQIEACLNSRPLTPLSQDPNDLNPLTPAHFLIGERLTATPDNRHIDIPESRLTFFQHLHQLQQHFWERWSKEYISELQQRTRWKTTANTKLSPGVLVIIKEDHVPPLHWQLGRITELHPGKDNLTRVVSVKTSTGVMKRPVTKLCTLPIDESE